MIRWTSGWGWSMPRAGHRLGGGPSAAAVLRLRSGTREIQPHGRQRCPGQRACHGVALGLLIWLRLPHRQTVLRGVMGEGIHFQPATASAHASEMNWLFGGLLVTSGMILALVFGLMIVFCMRYRRNSPAERGNRLGKTWRLEVAGRRRPSCCSSASISGVPIFMSACISRQRYAMRYPGRRQAVDVEGRASRTASARSTSCTCRVDEPVRLVMTSQDVIHSFFVPAFRIKQDVAARPLRRPSGSRPTKVGDYHLFCAEFCGTDHAAHDAAAIIVMEPADYAALAAATRAPAGRWRPRGGGCSASSAAAAATAPRAPCTRRARGSLRHAGAPGGRPMRDAPTKRYIRDSILLPEAQSSPAIEPIMPSFAGQIGEEDL